MKAKELAKILNKYPEAEVVFQHEEQETDDITEVKIEKENIFISDYDPDLIIFADSYLLDIIRRNEKEYVEIMTRPYNK